MLNGPGPNEHELTRVCNMRQQSSGFDLHFSSIKIFADVIYMYDLRADNVTFMELPVSCSPGTSLTSPPAST